MILSRFHSPLYIFIRSEGMLSDQDVFDLLNIDYELFLADDEGYDLASSIYTIDIGDWFCIMDNWEYGLENHKTWEVLEETLNRIGQKYEMCFCYFDECDGYEIFCYFKNGIIQRKVIKRQNGVIEDIEGNPFSFEKYAKKDGKQALDFSLSIVESIGIETKYDFSMIRHYCNLEELKKMKENEYGI